MVQLSKVLVKSHLVLVAIYALANTLHFAMNADFISFYPYMPEWIGPGTVYRAWILVNSVGLAGVLLYLGGYRLAANCTLVAYGLFGLDGLLHYSLDLFKDHDLVTNLAIGGEALTGLALCIASVSDIWRSSTLWVSYRCLHKNVSGSYKASRCDAPLDHMMLVQGGHLPQARRPGNLFQMQAIQS